MNFDAISVGSVKLVAFEQVHARALEASRKYKESEGNLLRVLEEVRDRQIYFHKGYRSLYEYATRALGLSEGIAYALQVVLRKSDEVPELKAQISSGEMSLQSARRVAAVITSENKNEWLEKARSLPQRELEKAVAVANPQAAVPTRERSVAKNVNQLQVCVSDRGLAALKEVQRLMCGKNRGFIAMGDVIEKLAEFYVEKTDPVVKAERVLERGRGVEQKDRVAGQGVSRIEEQGVEEQGPDNKQNGLSTKRADSLDNAGLIHC